MQGVDGYVRSFKTFGEGEGERDLGQLALGVCLHPVVAALQHRVVEVYRALPGRGDVDDPRRGRVFEQRQQQLCELETAPGS